MSKELYEATIEYTKNYNGESWIATISDEKYIDMDTFERVKADLEAKLAESEERAERYKSWHNEKAGECAELNQQLAEKEEQVKQLKLDLGMFKSVNEFINGYGIEKAREVLLQTEKTKSQDKISFALEQLENVRHILLGHYSITKYKCVKEVCRDIDKQIDNQIKQLKEMK